MNKKNQNILNQLKNKGTGFVSPQNYFEEFQDNFNKKKNQLKSGFKIPEDYFNNLEDGLLNKNPVSSNSSSFKVPDQYFETIEDQLIKKLNTPKKPKVIPITNFRYLKIISLSIAASLLLFFGFHNFKPSNPSLDFDSLEISEIENWMNDDLIPLGAYQITDSFGDEYVFNEFDFTEDEITDYLKNVDIETLINEY